MNITSEQKQEFEKIEKEFLKNLQIIYENAIDSINLLRSKRKFIVSELILAFVLADTLSRYYKIIEGCKEEELNLKNEQRLKKWLNDFILTDKNNIYKQHKNEIRCNAELLWQLRNSLIHSFGLPKLSKDGRYIGFWGGSLQERGRIENEFQKRGTKITFIQPYLLIEAMLEGLLVQLIKMREMIKEKPGKYIQGILLAHKIIMEQGAVYIDASNKK